jgi:hypothetical protein
MWPLVYYWPSRCRKTRAQPLTIFVLWLASMSPNPITHVRYHLDASAPLFDKQYKCKDGIAYEDKTTSQV